MTNEIQAGHHRFPNLCARCGTERVAGLWPLQVQVKPQIHAASLLTIFAGSVLFAQKEKIVVVPVCAACGAWLTQQKKVDSWFSRLITVGVMIGILGGIPGAIGWAPFDRLNGLSMALFMAGGAVAGVVGAYLLTGLLFRRLPLWKGVTFCTWHGDELHFENATFRQLYKEILAR